MGDRGTTLHMLVSEHWHSWHRHTNYYTGSNSESDWGNILACTLMSSMARHGGQAGWGLRVTHHHFLEVCFRVLREDGQPVLCEVDGTRGGPGGWHLAVHFLRGCRVVVHLQNIGKRSIKKNTGRPSNMNNVDNNIKKNTGRPSK